MIEVSSLSVTLGGKQIVQDVSFTADSGQWLMIAGPNGAGKTSIVNAISQSIPYTGSVSVDGVNLRGMKSRVLARKGFDLLAEILPKYLERGCQLVMTGEGDQEILSRMQILQVWFHRFSQFIPACPASSSQRQIRIVERIRISQFIFPAQRKMPDLLMESCHLLRGVLLPS